MEEIAGQGSSQRVLIPTPPLSLYSLKVFMNYGLRTLLKSGAFFLVLVLKGL